MKSFKCITGFFFAISLFFSSRRIRDDISSKPESATIRSGNQNPTYEIDTKVENVHDSEPDYVADSQTDNEYNYVDTSHIIPVGTNTDDNMYSYAETPKRPEQRPSPIEEQSEKGGWTENTIYSTSNDDGDPNAHDEGWADNNVYGD